MPQEFIKDVSAELDYMIDWVDWLDVGESLSTSTWTVPDGLIADSDSFTVSTTTVWLSGGVADTNYRVINTVVTDLGRTDERSIRIKVRQR
jgi:hypothetical protein